MQTVIETSAYLSAAKDAGMNDEERTAIVDLIAANPQAGEIMPAVVEPVSFAMPSPAKGSRAAIASSLISLAMTFLPSS